jgi:hypothetical protein
MSSTASIGSRPIQSTYLPAGAQAGGKTAGASATGASGNGVAPLPVVEPVSQLADTVSLSKQGLETVSLSKQGLETHVAALGEDTVRLAQKFLESFAKKLFGGGNAGSNIEFDSASVHAQASVESGGTAATSYFNLSESASFIGTGTITTSDGQSFNFEIEVAYEASVEASGTQASPRPNIGAPDLATLTGRALPAIEFPGSLADLFKLLGRELQVALPKDPNRPQDGDQGNLSLRLLRLVNSAALLAPRAQPNDPKASAVDRSKALANSYGDKPASSEIAAA